MQIIFLVDTTPIESFKSSRGYHQLTKHLTNFLVLNAPKVVDTAVVYYDAVNFFNVEKDDNIVIIDPKLRIAKFSSAWILYQRHNPVYFYSCNPCLLSSVHMSDLNIMQALTTGKITDTYACDFVTVCTPELQKSLRNVDTLNSNINNEQYQTMLLSQIPMYREDVFEALMWMHENCDHLEAVVIASASFRLKLRQSPASLLMNTMDLISKYTCIGITHSTILQICTKSSSFVQQIAKVHLHLVKYLHRANVPICSNTFWQHLDALPNNVNLPCFLLSSHFFCTHYLKRCADNDIQYVLQQSPRCLTSVNYYKNMQIVGHHHDDYTKFDLAELVDLERFLTLATLHPDNLVACFYVCKHQIVDIDVYYYNKDVTRMNLIRKFIQTVECQKYIAECKSASFNELPPCVLDLLKNVPTQNQRQHHFDTLFKFCQTTITGIDHLSVSVSHLVTKNKLSAEMYQEGVHMFDVDTVQNHQDLMRYFSRDNKVHPHSKDTALALRMSMKQFLKQLIHGKMYTRQLLTKRGLSEAIVELTANLPFTMQQLCQLVIKNNSLRSIMQMELPRFKLLTFLSNLHVTIDMLLVLQSETLCRAIYQDQLTAQNIDKYSLRELARTKYLVKNLDNTSYVTEVEAIVIMIGQPLALQIVRCAGKNIKLLQKATKMLQHCIHVLDLSPKNATRIARTPNNNTTAMQNLRILIPNQNDFVEIVLAAGNPKMSTISKLWRQLAKTYSDKRIATRLCSSSVFIRQFNPTHVDLNAYSVIGNVHALDNLITLVTSNKYLQMFHRACPVLMQLASHTAALSEKERCMILASNAILQRFGDHPIMIWEFVQQCLVVVEAFTDSSLCSRALDSLLENPNYMVVKVFIALAQHTTVYSTEHYDVIFSNLELVYNCLMQDTCRLDELVQKVQESEQQHTSVIGMVNVVERSVSYGDGKRRKYT